MSKAEDENTFLADTVRHGNSTVYHLYEKYTLHPESTADAPKDLFERKCNTGVTGKKTKKRDELVELTEEQIRGDEDDYCTICLRAADNYDV